MELERGASMDDEEDYVREKTGASDAQKLADSIFQKRLEIEMLARKGDTLAVKAAREQLKYLEQMTATHRK
jgi:hypothetical protein